MGWQVFLSFTFNEFCSHVVHLCFGRLAATTHAICTFGRAASVAFSTTAQECTPSVKMAELCANQVIRFKQVFPDIYADSTAR